MTRTSKLFLASAFIAFFITITATSCPKPSKEVDDPAPPPPELNLSVYAANPQLLPDGRSLVEEYVFGDFAIIFTYHTMNNLESCGCSPIQLGGLAPRATLISLVKEKVPTIVIDIGAMLDGNESFHLLKASYQLRALKMMGYDAIGLGLKELAVEPENLQKLLDDAEIPYFSASALAPKGIWKLPQIKPKRSDIELLPKLNTDSSTLEPIAPAGFIWNIYGKRIGFLFVNFSEPEKEKAVLSSFTLASPRNVLTHFLEDEKIDVDEWVIVGEGYRMKIEQALKDFPQVSLVITGDYHQLSADKRQMLLPMKTPSGNGTWLNTFYFGGYIGVVNGIRLNKAIKFYAYNLPVFSTFEPQKEVEELITKDYRARLAEIFKQQSFKYKASVIIEPEQCATCHQNAYEKYKQSKHAHSLEALVEKGQKYNIECLPCHVTYDYTNDRMYPIQCTTCHKTLTYKHIFEAQSDVEFTEKDEAELSYKFCSTCHDDRNSPGFKGNFQQHAQLIKHTVD